MSDVFAILGVAQAKAEFIDDAERIGIDSPHHYPNEMAAINRLIERACAAAVSAHHAQVVAAVEEWVKDATSPHADIFALLTALAPTGGDNGR